MKLILVHLYDDFSGSPAVASKFLDSIKDNAEVELLLGNSNKGFLDLTGINKTYFFYRLGSRNYTKLIYFALSQISLAFSLALIILKCKKNNKNVTVIVNTLLPFSAAIISKLFGVRCVYYCHEVTSSSARLFRFLLFICKRFSNGCIFVSEFVRDSLKIPDKPDSKVIYNTYDSRFYLEQTSCRRSVWESKSVMMACSLKHYKGVFVFVELAKRNPKLNFSLLLNTTLSDYDNFITSNYLPKNLEVICNSPDLNTYYGKSFINFNLSDPRFWVETFGLTIIEAMTHGTPTIAPNKGGPIEILNGELSELLVDTTDIDKIDSLIDKLATDFEYWEQLSKASFSRCEDFSPIKYRQAVIKYCKDIEVL